MKYKICKLINGNGNITYQIKKKGWLFWSWVYAATGPLGHYEPLDFFTFEAAKDWVELEQKTINYYKNSHKQKIVECIEL